LGSWQDDPIMHTLCTNAIPIYYLLFHVVTRCRVRY
jgi:hypothetical protein